MKLRMLGTPEDYKRLLDDGKAQCFKFDSGVVITSVIDYEHPPERVLNVMLLGGERLEQWKDDVDKRLCGFARENDCNAIEFICRRGIERAFKPYGYRTHRSLMRKEL